MDAPALLWSFRAPFAALPRLLSDPSLRRHAVRMAAATAVTLVAVAVGAWFSSASLLDAAWTPQGELARAAAVVVRLLLFLLILAAGAASMPALVTAPLADALSSEVERSLGAGPAPPPRFLADALRSVGKTLLRVLLLLGGHAALLPLWLVPAAGPTGATILGSAWTMLWLAFEYVDVAGNRHGLGFSDGLRLLADNPGAALGLGAALWLLLWVPLVNLLLVPAAVVGGTEVFVRLRGSRRPLEPASRTL